MRTSNLSFIFLSSWRSVPKTQSVHEWDLELVSGADLSCNLHYFSSRSRSRGSRAPPWAENRPKTRDRIYHFILPKVFPVAACIPLPLDHLRQNPPTAWCHTACGGSASWYYGSDTTLTRAPFRQGPVDSSAELKAPRKLLRIRPEIFDL